MEIKQHSPMPSSPHYFRGRVARLEASSSDAASPASSTSSSSAPLGLNLSLASLGTVIKKEPRSQSPLSAFRLNGQGVVGSSTGVAMADSVSYVHHQGLGLLSPSPAKRSRNALGDECLPSPGQMSVDSMSPPPPQTSSSSMAMAHSVSSNYSPMSTGSYDPYSPGGKTGREDLSPAGSVNSYSADFGGGGDLKKKKGPVPRQQEELCLVCGDRASGYHYNALTCEGCKGFFRRSITKNAVYQCKYGNGCEIDMYMRRKCQECRLKKCLAVGMRAECVVPEYQCAVKREAKKAQKGKDRPVPTTSHNVQSSVLPAVKDIEIKSEVKPAALSGSSVRPLSSEQEELINRLVYFQEEFDQPSEDDLKKISTSGMHESDPEAKFKHITEMTILTVQLTVEFSKRLPGFDTMLREDQITLLKACSSEVMMLRCARRYDVNTDSIVFANNLPYTRESYNMAGVGDTADALFRFGRQMSLMKVDNAEYALLTAIVIFSERPGLIESRKVEKIQEIYLEALQAYVTNHRVRPITEFAKLLSVLTELRTLGNLNSEMCFSLKFKNKKLPPFLAEIWDVHG